MGASTGKRGMLFSGSSPMLLQLTLLYTQPSKEQAAAHEARSGQRTKATLTLVL